MQQVKLVRDDSGVWQPAPTGTYVWDVALFAPCEKRDVTVDSWQKAVGVAVGWLLAHDVTRFTVRSDDAMHPEGSGSVSDLRNGDSPEKVCGMIFRHQVL